MASTSASNTQAYAKEFVWEMGSFELEKVTFVEKSVSVVQKSTFTVVKTAFWDLCTFTSFVFCLYQQALMPAYD